jgi:hypothetical protein
VDPAAPAWNVDLPRVGGVRPNVARGRIGRFLRESGSKQAGAAVFSEICVRATRTAPPAMRRT